MIDDNKAAAIDNQLWSKMHYMLAGARIKNGDIEGAVKAQLRAKILAEDARWHTLRTLGYSPAVCDYFIYYAE